MNEKKIKPHKTCCSPSELARRGAMNAFLMNIQCLVDFYIQIF